MSNPRSVLVSSGIGPSNAVHRDNAVADQCGNDALQIGRDRPRRRPVPETVNGSAGRDGISPYAFQRPTDRTRGPENRSSFR